jgi:hypothetical protein
MGSPGHMADSQGTGQQEVARAGHEDLATAGHLDFTPQEHRPSRGMRSNMPGNRQNGPCSGAPVGATVQVRGAEGRDGGLKTQRDTARGS